MKPTNYISITLATLVMAFSVGCKKTDKPNTFLPSIKGGGTTGNGNESETGQGGKIGEEGGVTSTDGGEVGLTGLEDFENMLMDREAFAAQTVYFGFDLSEIEPGDTDNVNAVAEALSSSPQNKVLIEGHCDERGGEDRPADPSLTESAYRLNRRGEFVLLTPKPGNFTFKKIRLGFPAFLTRYDNSFATGNRRARPMGNHFDSCRRIGAVRGQKTA